MKNKTKQMSLGETIRAIRTIKGLSQSEIEKRTDLKREYLSKIENNDLKNPTLNTITRLCEGLGVSIIDLFPEEKSKLDFDKIRKEQENIKKENKSYKKMIIVIEEALDLNHYEE